MPATPTRGVGTGAADGWFMAVLTLGAGTGTGADWTTAASTQRSGTGARASGTQLPLKQELHLDLWLLEVLTGKQQLKQSLESPSEQLNTSFSASSKIQTVSGLE